MDPREGLLSSRSFRKAKKPVAFYAQSLAELEDAAAGDFLPTVCLDGEMGNLAAKFAIPVLRLFGIFDIAKHAELTEELAPEIFLAQEFEGLGVSDVAQAFQSVKGGLIARSEVVSEHRDVLVDDAL